MTKSDILRFFGLQRQIFGICPRSRAFFRLSDCRIFRRQRPVPDWLEMLEKSATRLDRDEQALDEREEELRESARARGRRQAAAHVKRIDLIFGPRKLNPDDARVLFHPIDYVVFKGMNRLARMKGILLLDRVRAPKSRVIQKSIETAVERGRYEWQTIRVLPDGSIKLQ